MHEDVKRAYETLRAHGHYPLMVVSLDDVKEYITEYAKCLSPSDDEIMRELFKLWRNWDSSEEWRYAVEHIMEQLEKESAQ